MNEPESIWDDPALGSSGLFVRFEQDGDTVEGDVTAVEMGTDAVGNPCPQVALRDDNGADRIVTASQAQLKALLREMRPAVGDRLHITKTHDEATGPGRHPKKCFTVSHTPAGARGTAKAVDPAEAPF